MKFGILVFPGTNGETDCLKAIESTIGQQAELVWHTTNDLSEYDCLFVPGGSAYGDYLRPGALASKAKAVEALKREASKGKYIIGLGNGFQILLEAGLLPGAVQRNASQKFQCEQVQVKISNNKTPITADYEQAEVVTLPIAHRTGNYSCDEATLASMEANGQIVMEYIDNPNGSIRNIAGISNKEGNVIGLMPHPERATNELLGSADGSRVFTSILKTWRENHGAATIG